MVLSVVITNLRAGPEQAYHDQGVREAHFGAVYGTVAGALEHGEDVMVLWVENYALDRGLRCNVSAVRAQAQAQAHGSWRATGPGQTQPCASFPCAKFMTSTAEPRCHSTTWGEALTCMLCSEDDMIERSLLVSVLAVVVKKGEWLASARYLGTPVWALAIAPAQATGVSRAEEQSRPTGTCGRLPTRRARLGPGFPATRGYPA